MCSDLAVYRVQRRVLWLCAAGCVIMAAACRSDQPLAPVVPEPVKIASFAPSCGIAGSQVVLTGTGFSATPDENMVLFRFHDAPEGFIRAIVDSVAPPSAPTHLYVRVPLRATSGHIVVSGRFSVDSTASSFSMIDSAAVVTTVKPTSAMVGWIVAITGAHFDSTSLSVTFNSVPASLIAVSSAVVTVRVPVGAATGDLVVHQACYSLTACKAFTVFDTTTRTGPFHIVAFWPHCGTNDRQIIITGTAFSRSKDSNIVQMRGGYGIPKLISAAIDSVSSDVPPTRLYVHLPALPLAGCIYVQVRGVLDSTQDPYTVLANGLRAQGVSRPFGVPGCRLTITGSGFQSDGLTGVFFNGVPATTVVVNSPQVITVDVPATATTGPILLGHGCDSLIAVPWYTIVPFSISDVAPATGPLGCIVTARASLFPGTPDLVAIGGLPQKLLSSTDTTVTFRVAPGTASGPLTIRANGITATGRAFTVVPRNHRIMSIAPSGGMAGQPLTIYGGDFSNDTSAVRVTIGTAPAKLVTVSADSIRVVIPKGCGTGHVHVLENSEDAVSPSVFTELVPRFAAISVRGTGLVWQEVTGWHDSQSDSDYNVDTAIVTDGFQSSDKLSPTNLGYPPDTAKFYFAYDNSRQSGGDYIEDWGSYYASVLCDTVAMIFKYIAISAYTSSGYSSGSGGNEGKSTDQSTYVLTNIPFAINGGSLVGTVAGHNAGSVIQTATHSPGGYSGHSPYQHFTRYSYRGVSDTASIVITLR